MSTQLPKSSKNSGRPQTPSSDAPRSEDAELILFFEWLSWQVKIDPRLACVHHVANERRVSWHYGKILKQKGVRSGVPDICAPIPSGKYHGLYIELKIKPNKLSKEQLDMLKLLHSLGHCAKVAWSGEEAIRIFREYLLGTIDCKNPSSGANNNT